MITLLLHAFFATGFAYFLSWALGGLTPTIAIVSLLFGTWLARRRAVGLIAKAPGLKAFAFSSDEPGTIESILAILMTYICVRHFAWLFVSNEGRIFTLNPNNFGDLPLHINYIKEIASGIAFPPANPSFASEVLRYPFGADLYSALWDIVGVPLTGHLFFVGAAATVISLIVLRWFGGWWAMGAFFLSGGLAGWSSILSGSLPLDLTRDVDWKNLTLAVFVTQRGILFALPMGLVLFEMTRRHFTKESPLSKKAMTTLGLCWGLLPLFHAHAFVIVSLMMAGVAVIELGFAKGLKTLLLSRMAFAAYLPAWIFVLRTSDGFHKASVVHWDGWWMTTFDQAPKFLLMNFGPWLLLPFAVLAAIFLSKKISRELKRRLVLELALYAGLFVIFFNVMLAPWAWDNIKILVFPYLGFARLAWVALDPLLPLLSRYAVAAALFGSGTAAVMSSIVNPSNRGLTLYQRADLARTEGALEKIPRWAVFAAANTHVHPLTYFGRLRAVGYEGHLWSHGINGYEVKMDRLKKLMTAVPTGAGAAEDQVKMARELGVTHIYWSQFETVQFGSEPTWPASFRNLSSVPGIEIYEVR